MITNGPVNRSGSFAGNHLSPQTFLPMEPNQTMNDWFGRVLTGARNQWIAGFQISVR